MPSLGKHDPLCFCKVTRERINQVRDASDKAPISLPAGVFDFDGKSEMRMKDTLDYWQEIGLQDTVRWTMADDTEQTFTQDELRVIFHDLVAGRARRALVLHNKAKAFKSALPDVTERDICPENWV